MWIVIVAKICFLVIIIWWVIDVLNKRLMVLSQWFLLYFTLILRIMMTYYLTGLLSLVEICHHTWFYPWCIAFGPCTCFNVDVADVYFLLLLILILFSFIPKVLILWLLSLRLLKSIFHFQIWNTFLRHTAYLILLSYSFVIFTINVRGWFHLYVHIFQWLN